MCFTCFTFSLIFSGKITQQHQQNKTIPTHSACHSMPIFGDKLPVREVLLITDLFLEGLFT